MSLFGETCERSAMPKLPPYLPTPNANEDRAEKYTLSTSYRHAMEGRQVHLAQVVRDARLTSSPQATPASHSHSPGSDWARKMTATYGRKFGDYWLSSDPPDSWVRTLLGTSIWGSMTCYLTWRKSATPRGRLLFRLVPSTPRTAGIASGLWPTPDTPSGGRAMPEGTTPTGRTPDGRKVTVGLENAARMWPTPRAEFDSGRHRGKPDTLHSAVKLWGTPTGMDHKDTGSMENVPVNGLLSRQVAEPGLKLNSAWVSRMMGYPDGWLTLDGEATR